MIAISLPLMISICLFCFGTGVLTATIIHIVIINREDGEQNEY